MQVWLALHIHGCLRCEAVCMARSSCEPAPATCQHAASGTAARKELGAVAHSTVHANTALQGNHMQQGFLPGTAAPAESHGPAARPAVCCGTCCRPSSVNKGAMCPAPRVLGTACTRPGAHLDGHSLFVPGAAEDLGIPALAQQGPQAHTGKQLHRHRPPSPVGWWRRPGEACCGQHTGKARVALLSTVH